MTDIVAIHIRPNEEWTSLTVPYGAELVWSDAPIPPNQLPGGIQRTFWKVSTPQMPGTRTVLIRTDSRPDPNSASGPVASSGMAGSKPFITDKAFVWVYDGPITGTYPQN